MGTVEQLAMLTWQGRVAGINYISGWDWLNYWPNMLQGMNYSLHAWKQPECPDTARDRVDAYSVDPPSPPAPYPPLVVHASFPFRTKSIPRSA